MGVGDRPGPGFIHRQRPGSPGDAAHRLLTVERLARQITIETARLLPQLGLSVGVYAGYIVTLEILFVVMHPLIAGVIFWRKSADAPVGPIHQVFDLRATGQGHVHQVAQCVVVIGCSLTAVWPTEYWCRGGSPQSRSDQLPLTRSDDPLPSAFRPLPSIRVLSLWLQLTPALTAALTVATALGSATKTDYGS